MGLMNPYPGPESGCPRRLEPPLYSGNSAMASETEQTHPSMTPPTLTELMKKCEHTFALPPLNMKL